MGAGLLPGARAVLRAWRLHQLHAGRRLPQDPGQLPAKLRPAGPGQAGLRSRQPLPHQPEHHTLSTPPPADRNAATAPDPGPREPRAVAITAALPGAVFAKARLPIRDRQIGMVWPGVVAVVTVIRRPAPGRDPFPGRAGRRHSATMATLSATRRRDCAGTGAGTGRGGRGLSHPQDGPLTPTGAAELRPGP